MGNVDRHRQAHDEFNGRDWDALAERFADDVTYTDHGRDVTAKGKQEQVEWLKAWPTMLSDAAVTEPKYYDAGNTSIAVFTGRGTNDGPLGPFPASGQRISWPLCEILTWNSQGQVTSGELFYDQMTILVQAGHMEA
ncbi:MAG: nuclear transport factor 2 family protein, partial [Actinomycetota bacterium]